MKLVDLDEVLECIDKVQYQIPNFSADLEAGFKAAMKQKILDHVRPADLAAAGLAVLDLLEELKKRIRRDKEDVEGIQPIQCAVFSTYTCVEAMIGNLESSHSAALDKYKTIAINADAFFRLAAWLEPRQRPPLLKLDEVLQKIGEFLDQARAEVEDQEGEEKDGKTKTDTGSCT